MSTLLNAKSQWAVLSGGDRQRLLVLGEGNGTAMEELAACLADLRLVIAGGDENHVAEDQKQKEKEETYGA